MEQLEMHILRKLWRHTYIGRRHTAIEEMKQGLPLHLRDIKIIERTIKNLINQGYNIPHIKFGDMRISINPEKQNEIKRILGIQ